MSVASDNDAEVFFALANPDSTRANAAESSPVRQSPVLSDLDEDDETPPPAEPPSPQPASPAPSNRASSRAESEYRVPIREDSGEPCEEQSDVAFGEPAGEGGGAFSQYMSHAAAGVSDALGPPPRRDAEAEAIEKSSMLADLERLREQGMHLSRHWTMDDDVHEMSYELRRITLQIDERNNIGMMSNGLQLLCTGIEMMSKRYKVLELDGWSNEVCRDMTKYHQGLGRLYRKYWRRSSASSPESDILLSLAGSIGMYHMRKTLTKKVINPMGGAFQGMMPPPSRRRGRSAPQRDDDDSSSDEEQLPP